VVYGSDDERALGLQFAKAGHEVMFSSRNPDSLKDLVARAGAKARAGLPADAAKFGDVIVIAVPYGALPQVGKDYGPLMKGKVVIELGNPRADRDGPMATEAIKKGTGIASAEYLPGPVIVGGLSRAREFDTGTPVYVKGLTARQLREALKLP